MHNKNLKTPLIILLLVIALAGGYFLGGMGGHGEHGSETAADKGAAEQVQYTCGMHPFIRTSRETARSAV